MRNLLHMNEEQKTSLHARNLMILGYRDYIAARYLLNSDMLIQGVTLASTAVEKYLKVLLYVLGFKRKLHMEDWKELKTLLSRNGIDIFTELDNKFMELLCKVYKLRYYDKVQNEVNYCFVKWQVIAELDFVIGIIEARTTFKYSSGLVWNSPYKEAVLARNEILFHENYYLNGLDKKKFMEREGKVIAVKIDKNLEEIIAETSVSNYEYKGEIIEPFSFEVKTESLAPNIGLLQPVSKLQ